MTDNFKEKFSEFEKYVEKASDLLLEFWPGNEEHPKLAYGHLEIEEKGDGTAVTKADFLSNETIIEGLQKIFPKHGILSEELPRDTISNFEKMWIIDPLDGTQSFIDGHDDFSILVAYAENSIVQKGILKFPAKKIMAYAGKGEGAYASNKILSVSNEDKIKNKKIYLRNVENLTEKLEFEKMMDSGFAQLNVASGNLDGLIIKLGRHKEWDLAAPSLLIQEAGGKVTDEMGNDIIFDGKNFDYQYYVASNGIIHEQLLDLINNS